MSEVARAVQAFCASPTLDALEALKDAVTESTRVGEDEDSLYAPLAMRAWDGCIRLAESPLEAAATRELALWTLTNVSSRMNCEWLIERGVLPAAVKAMQSVSLTTALQATWLLANCAAENNDCRQRVAREAGLLDNLRRLADAVQANPGSAVPSRASYVVFLCQALLYQCDHFVAEPHAARVLECAMGVAPLLKRPGPVKDFLLLMTWVARSDMAFSTDHLARALDLAYYEPTLWPHALRMCRLCLEAHPEKLPVVLDAGALNFAVNALVTQRSRSNGCTVQAALQFVDALLRTGGKAQLTNVLPFVRLAHEIALMESVREALRPLCVSFICGVANVAEEPRMYGLLAAVLDDPLNAALLRDAAKALHPEVVPRVMVHMASLDAKCALAGAIQAARAPRDVVFQV